MQGLVLGSAAGVFGTALMSVVMAGGRAAGLLGTPPPKEITENVEEAAGVRDDLPESAFDATWMGAHLAYGAVCGAIYAAARPRLPAPPAAAGLLFGGAVWAASYLGVMPALRLYPWPAEDSKSRMAVMVAAHLVYGMTTALAEARLREPQRLW